LTRKFRFFSIRPKLIFFIVESLISFTFKIFPLNRCRLIHKMYLFDDIEVTIRLLYVYNTEVNGLILMS